MKTMEKILKIEQHSERERWSRMDGYAITTDNQVIKLLIDSDQSCCENFGYFMSEDDLERFIGSNLIDITITDTALNTHKLLNNNLDAEPPYVYEGGIMFVNIHTSGGVLQFVAYNEHNGYYGHEAKVISQQLNHEEFL